MEPSSEESNAFMVVPLTWIEYGSPQNHKTSPSTPYSAIYFRETTGFGSFGGLEVGGVGLRALWVSGIGFIGVKALT